MASRLRDYWSSLDSLLAILVNLKVLIFAALRAGYLLGLSQLVDPLFSLAAPRTVGLWAETTGAQFLLMEGCFRHLSAGHFRAERGHMFLALGAKCLAPRVVLLWGCFISSSKGPSVSAALTPP